MKLFRKKIGPPPIPKIEDFIYDFHIKILKNETLNNFPVILFLLYIIIGIGGGPIFL